MGYKLSDVIDFVRTKIDEPSEVYIKNDHIKRYVNIVIADICEFCLLYEKIAKSIFPNKVQSVNLPDDFIKISELFINNDRYKRISFDDLKMYVGNNTTDYDRVKNIYYIRDNIIRFLQEQEAGKEMTLFYYAYYPELVNDTDELGNELNNTKGLDIIASGVIYHIMEQDGNYNLAQYWEAKYMRHKMELRRLNNYRRFGSMNMKVKRSIDRFYHTDDYVIEE